MTRETSQLLSGRRVQGRTIHALLVCDLMMSCGRNKISFVWVILEPMILRVGVIFIWSIFGGHGKVRHQGR